MEQLLVGVTISQVQIVGHDLYSDDESLFGRANQLKNVLRVYVDSQNHRNVLEAPVHEILGCVGHNLPLKVVKVVQSVNRYRVPRLKDRQGGWWPSGHADYSCGNRARLANRVFPVLQKLWCFVGGEDRLDLIRHV